MYTKEEADGSKMKEKTTDPITKVKYEKYGHISDLTDYFLIEIYKRDYEKYQGYGVFTKGMTKLIRRTPKYTL